MLLIRSEDDLDRHDLSPGVRRAARDALTTLNDAYSEPGRPYDPTTDGFVVVIDGTGDDDAMRDLLGLPLREAALEGVRFDRENGCFVAVVLHGNQFGLTLVVPDAPGLDPRVREWLLENLPDGEVPR